jgi:serine/threonine protein kinase
MGDVYRARDERLNGTLRSKSCRRCSPADRERLLRFEREAQTLAALNHPHIASIHRVDESAGTTSAPVMELVLNWLQTLSR